MAAAADFRAAADAAPLAAEVEADFRVAAEELQVAEVVVDFPAAVADFQVVAADADGDQMYAVLAVPSVC